MCHNEMFKVNLFLVSSNTLSRSQTKASEPVARGIHCCPICFYATSVSILWRIWVYTCLHTPDCVEIVYELPLLPNNTASETFYINTERCEMLTWYLTLGPWPGPDWANTWQWTTCSKIFLSYKKYQRPQLLPHFVRYRIPRRELH